MNYFTKPCIENFVKKLKKSEGPVLDNSSITGEVQFLVIKFPFALVSVQLSKQGTLINTKTLTDTYNGFKKNLALKREHICCRNVCLLKFYGFQHLKDSLV